MCHLIPQFLPKEPNHPRHSMNIEKYVSVVERFFRNGYAFLISREGAGEDATEQKQHGNKIKKTTLRLSQDYSRKHYTASECGRTRQGDLQNVNHIIAVFI